MMTDIPPLLLIQRRRTYTACMTRRDISDFTPGTFLFYLVPQPAKKPIRHIQKDQEDDTCEHQCSVVLPEAQKLQQGKEDEYRSNRAIDGHNPTEDSPDDHLEGQRHFES